MNTNLDRFRETFDRAREEIRKVIIGQDEVVEMALITIFTRNHALIEGVPGVAKTLLVRTLGAVLDCATSRIQFTPDLMPADITGTRIYNMHEQEFVLVKGPVFTSFLLADEINRAPAKTQSALLQAMQERSVSIEREAHLLDPNFTVFATQNPIEYEGVYPLPEAQKDRFMLKISMDYPELEEERSLANRMLGEEAPEAVLESDQVLPVIRSEELAEVREALKAVVVQDELVESIVDIVRETRRNESALVGAGPRATQALLLAARASAALALRDFVTPDDVKRMASPVLEHRLVLRPEYEIEGLTERELIERILQQVAVPR